MRTTHRSLVALLLSGSIWGQLLAQSPHIVRVGSSDLQGANLRSGTDTVDDFVVKDGVRQANGTTIRSIASLQDSSGSAYQISSLQWNPQGDTTVTTMVVRGLDLSLVFHRVKGTHDSAAVTASRIHLTAWVVLPDQPVRLLDLDLEHPVFGVEGQVPWLLPLLPFAPGYTAVVPHFSPWSGREKWDTVSVVGSEQVVIGARTYDCWKVDTGPLGPPGYRMTRWIDKRTRRIVQSALRGTSPGTEYWSYLRS